MKFLTIFILVTIFFTSVKAQNSPHKKMQKVVVQEVLQVNNYTYLRVLENGKEQWLAMPTINAKVGETYYYDDGMAMGDFESKELGRTFKNIIFLAKIHSDPNKTEKPGISHTKTGQEKINLKVEHSAGTVTIAELLANKEKYAGKTVRIKGKVTKFNSAIMGKNWIHIQDGTEHSGEYDLTVTTSATTETGKIISLEGKIVLNKDFGHGYFYKILMEDAVLK